jgi:hypothetical protein
MSVVYFFKFSARKTMDPDPHKHPDPPFSEEHEYPDPQLYLVLEQVLLLLSEGPRL